MLTELFRRYGQWCASRPWEVMFGTIALTVCLSSMSLYAGNDNITPSVQPETVKSSDVIVLAITRCLAVICVYLQFTNLRKLGSKYLLGIAGFITVFSSFVFSTAVINLIGSDLTGLNEALPFFLLLIDLSKAGSLARFALASNSQTEVPDNIGRGMAILGPAITLDALVKTLVIGVGTLSGVPRLETMCSFGCLSVIANFFAFMTFYPACLALILELSRERNQHSPLWNVQHLPKLLQEEENVTNPVTQRIKMIMSAGLVLVHAHSRLVPSDRGTALDDLYAPADLSSEFVSPTPPLWHIYFMQYITPGLDYGLTLGLTAVLGLKYMMWDSNDDTVTRVQTPNTGPPVTTTQPTHTGTSELLVQASTSGPLATASATKEGEEPITDRRQRQSITAQQDVIISKSSASFIIGDFDTENGLDPTTVSIATQTEPNSTVDTPPACPPTTPRSLDVCVEILRSSSGPSQLSDAEVISLVKTKHIPSYKLESVLGDHTRAVDIRRQMVTLPQNNTLDSLPYNNYNYKYVEGACCENVIGYMPVPVGVAGPLLLDGVTYTVPMATTEGCLVASTNRGCRALTASGGVRSCVIGDGMTRAPVVRLPSAAQASQVKLWLEDPDNVDLLAEAFNSTSRFARLKKIQTVQAARNLYIRFVAVTGDAMGMNMLSKGSERALLLLREDHFPELEILSLSGNFCTDKKSSAINWLEGRGKSVVCEAIVPSSVVKSLLKTSVSSLVDLHISKNLMGSALAGSVGGFNAHAANAVAAIFIATGQDVAQTVCSSNCMTVMEVSGEEDLYISCTMPSLEVGTVGGGTVLPPQAACLKLLGVHGSSSITPGTNAATLARVICGTVMAGELSLMSALAAGHLVKSHLKHNRSSINVCGENSVPPAPAT